MTAARYYPPTPQPEPPLKTRRTRRRSQTPDLNRSKVTQISPRRQQLPESLQFLLLIQKSSSTLTFALVTLTLIVYGWTVCVPSLWSQEFRRLTKLQQDERQLVGTNETLKHQLAEQAQKPGSGLTQPHPSQSIFLPPTKVSPIVPKTTASAQGDPFVPETPIAY
ncbi:conserved hypothetical protein [Rippkaea orientalis PCC 8801]|uniref:Cell division protein FtsL n=1 Tax=Rippkaea orientalis (strain PCC 8801 / RF-1) TaxID=41431 RepID=B7K2A3_RIPO1|nr:hypothetical protein [Rippkaea orientalis]ACK65239.1 conserved hypothetical protein [Rippkaea orientalis PCC 8801]